MGVALGRARRGSAGLAPTPAELARLGVRGAERAAEQCRTVGLADPVRYARLWAGIGAAGDPDLALRGLLRLLEAVGETGELATALAEEPTFVRRLVSVLGASAALGEFLIRHPQAWRSLAEAELPEPRVWRPRLLAAVGAAPTAEVPVAAPASSVAREALRAAWRAGLLVVAGADLAGQVGLEEVTGQLSALAAAALEAALAVSRKALLERGAPAAAAREPLGVVGLGKLGAGELNYVSDVDVLFVAGPDGRAGGVDGVAAGADARTAAPPGPPAAAGDRTGQHDRSGQGDLSGAPDRGGCAAGLAVATRLAEGLIAVCSEPSAEGALFTVDVGLRPEGRHGPLVRSLASHEAYYRRWARGWEFQALLKARPVAGDAHLGGEFCRRLAPLVWSASGADGFVAGVQDMRRRVEHTVAVATGDRELKLGAGGLRDIEFAVQLLCLVHGRTDASLRVAATLPALASLAAGGYVGRVDAQGLDRAYRWLRTVEHRLQLEHLRRTHTVPTDPVQVRWLARACGYAGEGPGGLECVEAFEVDRVHMAAEVRRLHEKLFYRPLLAATARLPADEARLDPERARERLEALGFAEPAAALRHIQALTTGLSRRAAIQRTLLPVLLVDFAAAADPDAGLLAFRQVSEALGDTPWYLRSLRDEGAVASRLVRLLAGSRYVAELLTRAPEGVAMLAEESALAPRAEPTLLAEALALVERHRGASEWEAGVAAIRGLRRRELLRTSAADALGLLGGPEVGEALSAVTRVTLEAALALALDKVGAERRAQLPMSLAIVALGRLGGAELGYASDADVLFVHAPRPGADPADAAAAAQAVAEEVRRMLALPAPDPPLVVDAALRPEGRQGPLTRSLDSYAAYYQRWAGVWEAQALLRAAPAAGDPFLTGSFLALVDPVRYPVRLSVQAWTEIRHLKARMERERVPRGVDPTRSLKFGPGGLADVEWAVQALQLRHGHRIAGLRTPRTLTALRAAGDAGLLDPPEVRLLEEAWVRASRVRDALTLLYGRPVDELPAAGSRELDGLVQLLGYPSPHAREWLEVYAAGAAAARALCRRVLTDG